MRVGPIARPHLDVDRSVSMTLEFKLHILSRFIQVIDEQVVAVGACKQTFERKPEADLLHIRGEPRESIDIPLFRLPISRGTDDIAAVVGTTMDGVAR